MDQNIYFPGRKEFGVYATRRYPRGSGGGVLTPLPVGGIQSELNPTPIVLGLTTAAVAPHAETERFRYTVPPKRRLKIQSTLARMIRTGVAAPVGEYSVYAAVIRAGGVVASPFALAISGSNVAFGDKQDNNNGEQEFFEGDIILGRTYDLSTGGTVRYNVEIVAVEYDAFFKSQNAVQSGQYESVSSSGEGVSSYSSPYSGGIPGAKPGSYYSGTLYVPKG